MVADSLPSTSDEGQRPTHDRRRRRNRVAIVVAGVTAVAVGSALAFQSGMSNPDERYLASLRAEEMAGQFNSDANAVAQGRKVCRDLRDGGEQEGRPADKIAVDVYCSEFSKGYDILEKATIRGTFVLRDYSIYSSGIFATSSGCTGDGGYDDIGAGTQVTVRDDSGAIVTHTELGEGTGNSVQCTFPFTFEIAEGSDTYTVAVGRRGQLSYSFTELKLSGVELSLGD